MKILERNKNGETSVIDLTPVSDLNPNQRRYLTEILNIAMKSKTKLYEWIMKNPKEVSRINELYEQLKKCKEECSYGRVP